MFGPKKSKLSKSDLKKSIVNANERLKAANARMEADLQTRKNEFKLLEVEYKETLKALEDTKDLQEYAKNELEATQEDIRRARSEAKKASCKVEELDERSNALIANNTILETKEVRLTKSVSLLEGKKAELKGVSADLKAMKKEQSDVQETLSLLGKELNDLEVEVESYDIRKSVVESEFGAFKAKIYQDKRLAEEELRGVENISRKLKHSHGEEMGRLDHAIADRMSEIKDLEEEKRVKEYELSTVKSMIGLVETRVNDAEERIEYSVKKEREKVSKIKGDFKSWKVEALDEIARMKMKGKIENIDKAGLKEALDG